MDKIKVIVLNKQMKLETITFPIVMNSLGNFGVMYQGDFYKLNPQKVFLWNNKPTILLNSTFHADIITQMTDEQLREKIQETFNRIKDAKNER
jgi:hypothetical protein